MSAAWSIFLPFCIFDRCIEYLLLPFCIYERCIEDLILPFCICERCVEYILLPFSFVSAAWSILLPFWIFERSKEYLLLPFCICERHRVSSPSICICERCVENQSVRSGVTWPLMQQPNSNSSITQHPTSWSCQVKNSWTWRSAFFRPLQATCATGMMAKTETFQGTDKNRPPLSFPRQNNKFLWFCDNWSVYRFFFKEYNLAFVSQWRTTRSDGTAACRRRVTTPASPQSSTGRRAHWCNYLCREGFIFLPCNN